MAEAQFGGIARRSLVYRSMLYMVATCQIWHIDGQVMRMRIL